MVCPSKTSVQERDRSCANRLHRQEPVILTDFCLSSKPQQSKNSLWKHPRSNQQIRSETQTSCHKPATATALKVSQRVTMKEVKRMRVDLHSLDWMTENVTKSSDASKGTV